MSGTGKSHLAIALGLACVHGYSVRYTTSGDMLTELHLALTTQDLQLVVHRRDCGEFGVALHAAFASRVACTSG